MHSHSGIMTRYTGGRQAGYLDVRTNAELVRSIFIYRPRCASLSVRCHHTVNEQFRVLPVWSSLRPSRW